MKLLELSLRELFLLVALVAMGCGWWVERVERQRVEAQIEALKVESDMWQARAESMGDWINAGEHTVTWDGYETTYTPKPWPMPTNPFGPARI